MMHLDNLFFKEEDDEDSTHYVYRFIANAVYPPECYGKPIGECGLPDRFIFYVDSGEPLHLEKLDINKIIED